MFAHEFHFTDKVVTSKTMDAVDFDFRERILFLVRAVSGAFDSGFEGSVGEGRAR